MKTTSLQLLPATSWQTAVGNYDGESTVFSGDAVKAPAYYTQGSSLQTVAFFTSALSGNIVIQGTLVSTPSSDSDWVDLYTFEGGSDNSSTNITGNFTWIRATVTDFTAGTINKVILSY